MYYQRSRERAGFPAEQPRPNEPAWWSGYFWLVYTVTILSAVALQFPR